MFDSSSLVTTDRRGFVSLVASLGAGATLGTGSTVGPLLASSVSQSPAPSDAWLDRLRGKHRQLFDAPDPEGGIVLRHVRNYLETWREAYGVVERELSAIVALHARSTPLGLQDAMWAKYRLGAALSITDSTTSAPLVRNWFAHPRHGDPVADGTPESSIESLQRRGVVFALCNNALKRWSARLEQDGMGTAADVHDDLAAHALPGVVIVPDVVITMTKAHERGFGYFRS